VNHSDWTRLLSDVSLPAAVVDLDALDRNILHIRGRIEKSGKKLRVASKSVRIPEILKRIFEVGGPSFHGILTYSVRESTFLHSAGFRDLVVAYPTLQKSDLETAAPLLLKDSKALTFMVDSKEHLIFLSEFHKSRDLSGTINVCIDIDMSYRPFGLHLGVRRSPIRSLDQLSWLLDELKQHPGLNLRGMMGYEAQIAGMAESNPFAPILNPAKKLIKKLSIPDVAQKRQAIHALLQARGVQLEFFNGGGSGSLDSTLLESPITEATAGSGFLQSHLFDYYTGNRNEAALYIALRASRRPEPGILVCQGGGIIGSGEISDEKAMIPVSPKGLTLLGTEGCGEVQTPLRVPPKTPLGLGDPILFRPAKAGEPLERFREIHLLSNGHLVGTAPTYRGLNQEFQ
jgi:D-serine deaminase-like pyridoxal phosphate-dependent protein